MNPSLDFSKIFFLHLESFVEEGEEWCWKKKDAAGRWFAESVSVRVCVCVGVSAANEKKEKGREILSEKETLRVVQIFGDPTSVARTRNNNKRLLKD